MASPVSYKQKTTTPAQTSEEPIAAEPQKISKFKQALAKLRLSNETQIKVLPPLAIGLSVLTTAICLYYASVFQTQLSKIDADVIDQLGNDLAQQQQIQTDLLAQFERYQQQTQTQISQIESGQGQNPSAHIKQVIKVLEAQQQDYRAFLRILRQGMIEVSQMTRGSREWTADYINQMGKVNDKSLQRSQELKAIDPPAEVRP